MQKRLYIFIRHGNAAIHVDDEKRPLTDRGERQAKERGFSLRQYEPFDLVITSSALRTKETAKNLLTQLSNQPKIVAVPELYFPQGTIQREHVQELIDQFSSKPLRQYIENDLDNCWDKYTNGAFAVIEKEIEKNKAQKILIVGHGNIINSLGLMLAPEANELMNIYFDYCQGFIIDEVNNKTSTVEMLR